MLSTGGTVPEPAGGGALHIRLPRGSTKMLRRPVEIAAYAGGSPVIESVSTRLRAPVVESAARTVISTATPLT